MSRLKTLLVILGILLLGSGVFLAKNTVFKPKPPKPMQSIGFENISKDFPSKSEETNEKNSTLTRRLCAQSDKDSLTYEALCEDTAGETKGVQTGNSGYNFDYGSDSKDYTSSNPFSFSNPSNPSSPYTSNPQSANKPSTQSSFYLNNFNTAKSDGNNAADSLKPIVNSTNNYKYQHNAASASCSSRGLRNFCPEASSVFQNYKNSVNKSLQTATNNLQLADIYIKGSRPYPSQWQTSFAWLEVGLSSLAEAILTTQSQVDSGKWADTAKLNNLIQDWYSSSDAASSSVP